MGYSTDFYGEIKLSSKKVEDKLKNFIKDVGEDLEEHFNIEGIVLVDKEIEISGYGKLYNDELEEFCLFIAKTDPKSHGEIRCKGEDSDDLWRIVIGDGKVRIEGGVVSYLEDEGTEFKSNKINKDVYIITKDKNLLKELIIEGL